MESHPAPVNEALSTPAHTLGPSSQFPEAPPPRPARVLSVDALRGFDMFWIIGGEQVAQALEKLGGGPVISTIANQLQHAEWAGFRFYDAIFPLFLFLIGVSIVFSMGRMVATEGPRGAIARVVRRTLLLFVIGIFYYGGISRAWPDVALSGVLHRIAICYGCAALLFLFLPRKGIIITATVCLVGYWAVLIFVPFPDVDLRHNPLGKKGSQTEAKPPATLLLGVTAMVSGTFAEGRNLAHYVDYRWLPGRKRNLYYTNEGLLSTISAVATTLFGVMAGWLLISPLSPRKKAAWLLGAGAAGIALGMLCSLQIPIIKRIWTPSFCLVASGVSAMFLGGFYFIVDVLRWQRWCVPFLWIGANALAVYLAVNLADFPAIAERFAGGDVKTFLDSRIATGVGGVVIALVALALPVLFTRFLYQKKIFIRL